MSRYIHFNGEIIPSGKEIITADNRGLRYGDGLFETIKVVDRSVQLASFHIERLFHGVQILQIQLPGSYTPRFLTDSILALCNKNNVQHARVRLTVFRGNGGLYNTEDAYPNLVIQAEPLPDEYLQFNEKGLTIDTYHGTAKSCDILANLKSNNYLPYIMGALHAKQQGLNDCLILNTHARICDSTIANVFWIEGNKIFTPPLSEGCVAGVMRRHLLEQSNGEIQEQTLTPSRLENADEVFLTNALTGIRWVQQFRNKQYAKNCAADLYLRYIKNFRFAEHS